VVAGFTTENAEFMLIWSAENMDYKFRTSLRQSTRAATQSTWYGSTMSIRF